MIKQDRSIIHVEVKSTGEHFYFGSIAAMFEDPTISKLIGIKYQTFRTKKLSEENPYSNSYLIVRKGHIQTISHTFI